MHTGDGRESTGAIYTEVQVRHALRAAGIRVASEIPTHFIVFCEYHDNHNTPSAEVDKTNGLFYCFSCQATTDLPHLIMKVTGGTYFNALRIIGDTEYNIADEVDRLLASTTIEAFDQGIVDRLHSDVWGVGSDYFHSRNINDDSIRTFELGYSNKQRMVTVPVHSPTGVLWGFVGRSIEGKRFKNNKGLSKGLTLFNVHRVWTASRVFVLESSFDAIRLHQLGLPAVATLGAGITKEQLDILKRTFDYVVLIPDNDAAGLAMTNKVLSVIPHADVLTIDGAHDVGDLSDSDLTTLV